MIKARIWYENSLQPFVILKSYSYNPNLQCVQRSLYLQLRLFLLYLVILCPHFGTVKTTILVFIKGLSYSK